MRLRRSGLVVVGAAGATNTMGQGGPLTCSRGTVPQDAGNRYMIAIEAANNGAGEAWPSIMLDNYISLIAALCEAYDLDASRDIFTHHSYCEPSCPGRKVDPAGPTPSIPTLGGTSGCRIWSHDDVRALVLDRLDHPIPHPPEEPVTEEEIERIATRAAEKVWATMTKDITTDEDQSVLTLLRYTRSDANKTYNIVRQ